MSFVKKVLGGGSSSKQTQTTTQQYQPPLNIYNTTSTGSKLTSKRSGTRQITHVRLPSDIAANRAEVLGGFEGMLDKVRGSNSAFIQAAINPVIERLTGIPGQVQRDLSRRGVFGSLSDQSVRNAKIDVARAIGDATKEAEQQQLATEASILTNIRGVTQDKLQQELAELGLSSNTINSVIASQLPTSSSSAGKTGSSDASQGLRNVGNLLLAGSFLSDERLKENIEYVGIENGFNLYKFNYIGHAKKYIGVLASEVKRIMPEAVSVVNGYFMIDYDKIGINMKGV